MKALAILFVRGYRAAISPVLGPRCRYYPTCSAYMREALERHGFLKGGILGILRIARCHPWHTAACWRDPVPKAFAWRDLSGYKRSRKQETSCFEVKGSPFDDE